MYPFLFQGDPFASVFMDEEGGEDVEDPENVNIAVMATTKLPFVVSFGFLTLNSKIASKP